MGVGVAAVGTRRRLKSSCTTGAQSSFTLCLPFGLFEKYRCAFLMCGHFPHPRLEKCSQNNPLSLWLLLGAFLAFLLSVIYIHSCQALVVDQTGWSKGASINPRVQGMIPSEGIWEVRFFFHEIAPVLRSSGADWARQ